LPRPITPFSATAATIIMSNFNERSYYFFDLHVAAGHAPPGL
jgi:hypothetical protein